MPTLLKEVKDLQSSHLIGPLIKYLVYIRIMIKGVVRTRYIVITAIVIPPCDGGLIKFGTTPGGGVKPGSMLGLGVRGSIVASVRNTALVSGLKKLDFATRKVS